MIRKATLKDLPALAITHIQTWRETYAGVLPDDLLASMTSDEKEESWRPALVNEDSGVTVFVAEDSSGHIVGLAACSAQRDPALAQSHGGEFLAIYVLKFHQNKGLGLRLMHAMCEDLRGRGIENAALWVLADNHAGLPFYRGLHGEEIAKKNINIGNAVKMELALGWNVTVLLTELDKKLSKFRNNS